MVSNFIFTIHLMEKRKMLLQLVTLVVIARLSIVPADRIWNCDEHECNGHGYCRFEGQGPCDCYKYYIDKTCQVLLRFELNDGLPVRLRDQADEQIVPISCLQRHTKEPISYNYALYNNSQAILCGKATARNNCSSVGVTVRWYNANEEWSCHVTDPTTRLVTKASISLDVRFPPTRITVTEKSFSSGSVIQIGSKQNITCETDTAIPAPIIQWMRGGEYIKPDDDSVYVTSKEKEGTGEHEMTYYTISTLHIFAYARHVGMPFRCTVKDSDPLLMSEEMPVDTGTIPIKIVGPTRPVALGSTLSLRCLIAITVPGGTLFRFQWKLNGLYIDKATDKFYWKENVSEVDDGVYNCEVRGRNLVGEGSYTVTVGADNDEAGSPSTQAPDSQTDVITGNSWILVGIMIGLVFVILGGALLFVYIMSKKQTINPILLDNMGLSDEGLDTNSSEHDVRYSI